MHLCTERSQGIFFVKREQAHLDKTNKLFNADIWVFLKLYSLTCHPSWEKLGQAVHEREFIFSPVPLRLLK